MRRRSSIVAALLAITAAGLFLRVWRIGDPDRPVFDEAYYVRYSTAYCCSHEYYSDLHPPLPKLILAIPGFFSRYDGRFPFNDIGDARYAPTGLPIVPMRLIVACCGALLIPLVFVFVRELGGGPTAAIIAAILIAADNGLLIDSRYVLLNQFLLVGIVGCLVAVMRGARRDLDLAGAAWFSLAGAAAGLAVGTKLTGLIAPGGMVGLCARELWLSTTLGKAL